MVIECRFSHDDDALSDGSAWTWAGAARTASAPSWRIVARRLKADQLVLTGLKPSTSYTLLVRAENSHGLSLPSPTSPWFTTLSSGKKKQDNEITEKIS